MKPIANQTPDVPKPAFHGLTVREVLEAAGGPAHAGHTATRRAPTSAGETTSLVCSCGATVEVTAEAAGRLNLPILEVDALLRARLGWAVS